MQGPSHCSITSPSALQALHGLKTSVQTGKKYCQQDASPTCCQHKKIDSKAADPTHFLFFLQQTPINVQIFFFFLKKKTCFSELRWTPLPETGR